MEVAILAISFGLSLSQPGHAHVSMLNRVKPSGRAIICADSLRPYLLRRFQEISAWPESASLDWD